MVYQLEKNIILETDSYKLTHWLQYPQGTESVFSYFESRNGAKYPETLFFGLQYLIEEYLVGHIVTLDKIDEAQLFVEAHLGDKRLFNRAGWVHIVEDHDGTL